MKTIILCGGIGYRLKEETEFKPKPMVLVGGKPILWHIMKIYSHYGFNEFIIALGYKGDYIKQYFLNQKQYAHNFTIHTGTGYTKLHKDRRNKDLDNFKITFVNTGESTLPGERIKRCEEFIPVTDDHFMVTYGDGVSNVNIRQIVNFHKSKKAIGTILGVHPRSKFGLIQIDKDGFAKRFIEKPVLKEWVNGGFMIFTKDFFSYLKEGEMEHDALKRLVQKKQLSIFVHDGFWHCMDTYNDVDTLNKLWKDNPHLVKELVKRKAKVIVVDIAIHPKSFFAKEKLKKEVIYKNIDIRNRKKVLKLFEVYTPDYIFHLAAEPIVATSYKSPVTTFETNIMGAVNILEAARVTLSVKCTIFASSDKAYGKTKKRYIEESPLKGDHPYDVSKSSADLIAQAYFKTYNTPVIITRFGNVYGEGDLHIDRIIPGICKAIAKGKTLKIRSDGTYIRDYIYVKDVVDGYITLLVNFKKIIGEPFNFSSDTTLSVLGLVRESEKVLKADIPYSILNNAKNEIPYQHLDDRKIRKLGWKRNYTFGQGLKNTYKWYKNNLFS